MLLLDTLKEQTRARHSALEALNGLPNSPQEYLALLESFHGFIAPWEREVAVALPPNDPIRAGREKTGWLEADLLQLGHTPATIGTLPRCADLPPTRSREEILGSAYVLEGSTLGGQFIARHLAQVLKLTPGQGDRYIRSYGPQVGEKWQAFRQELLRCSSPENDPVIIGSARDTFAKLHVWFAARSVVA